MRIKEFVCFLQENEKLFRMPVNSYDGICYRIRLSYHNCKEIWMLYFLLVLGGIPVFLARYGIDVAPVLI